jgi:hypothetical protein
MIAPDGFEPPTTPDYGEESRPSCEACEDELATCLMYPVFFGARDGERPPSPVYMCETCATQSEAAGTHEKDE